MDVRFGAARCSVEGEVALVGVGVLKAPKVVSRAVSSVAGRCACIRIRSARLFSCIWSVRFISCSIVRDCAQSDAYRTIAASGLERVEVWLWNAWLWNAWLVADASRPFDVGSDELICKESGIYTLNSILFVFF